MTSREIFEAVLTFARPPRVGMTLPDPYPNDLLDGGWRGPPAEPLEPRGGELRRWRDEWGITWASLTDYDKVLGTEPNDAEVIVNRGVIHYSLGKLDEAIDEFSRALRADPKSWRALYNRGECRIMQARYDEAVKDLSAAIPLAEDDAILTDLHVLRAIALYRKPGFREEGRCPRDMKLANGIYIDSVLMYRFVK